jgi:TRAP-type C4-dicarboxylate transport system permease large subunit
VLPFMVGMAICITLLLMFPGIALWLPDTVMGK